MNDPIDRLRAANPVPETDPSTLNHDRIFASVTGADAAPATNDRALFSAPPTQESVRAGSSRQPRRGRVVAGVAAAFVVGAMGFGAVSLIPSSTPAAAAMVQAAAATEAADTGTVTLGIELEDSSDTYGATLFSRFDGQDFSATLVEASGDDLGVLPVEFEVRVIDGEIYVSDGDMWVVVDDPNVMTALEATGFPLDIGTASAAVVDLVEAAESVEEVEPGHFRGTVTVGEIKAIAADHPSLEFFVPELFDTELDDEMLEIDLITDQSGAVDLLTLNASPTAPDGSDEQVDATLVIDFEDLGTEQVIERPADAQPLDLTTFAD